MVIFFNDVLNYWFQQQGVHKRKRSLESDESARYELMKALYNKLKNKFTICSYITQFNDYNK